MSDPPWYSIQGKEEGASLSGGDSFKVGRKEDCLFLLIRFRTVKDLFRTGQVFKSLVRKDQEINLSSLNDSRGREGRESSKQFGEVMIFNPCSSTRTTHLH